MNLEKQILEFEKRYWQTMIDKDTDGAAKLTADPCIVAGAHGVASIDKKHLAAVMETGSWELHDFELSDVAFEQFSDDVAVIAYKVRENLTVDGKPLTIEAADASTWVRKGDGWVCALHTESILGDPFGRDRKPMPDARAA